jgi:hypothetical protein
MYHPFSIVETLKSSWHILKTNFVVIVVFSVISFILLAVILTVIEIFFTPDEFTQEMILFLIEAVLQAYTTLGLYKLIFTVIDSEFYEFEFKQVLPSFRMLYSYLVAVFFLAFIVVTVGFGIDRLEGYPNLQDTVKTILLFPAFYLMLRLLFFNTFIVDDRSGPMESLVQSFKLTKGYVLKIMAISAIIFMLILVPAYLSRYFPPLSLIIIVTYPFVNIILVVTYRKLIYSHQDVEDDVSETI